MAQYGDAIEQEEPQKKNRPVGSLVLLLVGSVLIGVLVLTVIGIPVALLVLVGLLILSVMSIGVVGLTLGRRICDMISGRCGSNWSVLLLGLLLLDGVSILGHFAGLVPSLDGVSEGVIIIGAGVKLAAYLFGMGALLISRFGRA